MTGFALAMAPAARADDSVTFEVRSDTIPAVDIGYTDVSGRHVLKNATLPWRVTATVDDPHSPEVELVADWQPAADKYGVAREGRYKWVTARIYYKGTLLCESTLDGGHAICNGSGAYTGSGAIPLPPFP
ncbi:hypothetical protein [Mycolicibacterium septicum]|uniref:hypothetical protein n=1 Tax=Mycolicibacterium septicum TaxID=98668 RepID=UPI00235FC513|nr:hypothetical protein [Mycolicibacterium septicum]